MKLKEEKQGERAREGHSHCKIRSDKHRIQKAKAGFKEKHKGSDVNGKYHRPEKNSHSGSSQKPVQESKITSSEKLKSDAGNSGSEVEDVKLDLCEDLEKRAGENNNLEEVKQPQGKTDPEGNELAFVHEESKRCKSRNDYNKSSRKDRHKTVGRKDHKLEESRSENNCRKESDKYASDVTSNKSHAEAKQSDNSPASLAAVKGEDIEEQIFDPISGCSQASLPVQNDLEVRQEEYSAEKNTDKESTVNIMRDKTQGPKKRKSSQSAERTEPKRNKKAKKEKDDKKEKPTAEAKKSEDEVGKWKW